MSTDVVFNAVSKRYSAAKDSGGVFDINTVIPGGKFTTLLGESGSGKTTLLRLLAGFLRPDEGEITMADRAVASDAGFVPTQSRDLAMVFQSYALWPHMTVFQNVAFGLKAQKVSKSDISDRVHRTLDLVGLKGFDHRKPSQLSGGQQQRVALARSLVLEPSLLLLDEPLSNLDADLRIQMRNQLKELQLRTGITFVYVTHDQEEAFALSDHMIVLDHGTILQQGDCHDIYSRPESDKVAEFMGRRGLQLHGAIDRSDSAFVTGHPERRELGQFPHVHASAAAGTEAGLIVHSEDLVLCTIDDVSPDLVDVDGTVTAVSFAGRENHVVVLTDQGRETTVYASPTATWSVGQDVKVAFSREAAWIYASDRDASPVRNGGRYDASVPVPAASVR